MPGMKELTLEQGRAFPVNLIELKIDGSRMRYSDGKLISDRDVNRNARYGHVLKEVSKVNWKVRGEIAIPNSNVLELNARENWHRAKYYIFDIFEFEGKDVSYLTPSQARSLISQILQKYRLLNVVQPWKFESFDEGWKHVKKYDLEGLVLKQRSGTCWKVKNYKEEKLPIVGYEEGKSKGAFFIERDGVRSKVSGTSDAYVQSYKALVKRGLVPYAEIEYLFITRDGVPFQPRLRRVGTLEMLKYT